MVAYHLGQQGGPSLLKRNKHNGLKSKFDPVDVEILLCLFVMGRGGSTGGGIVLLPPVPPVAFSSSLRPAKDRYWSENTCAVDGSGVLVCSSIEQVEENFWQQPIKHLWSTANCALSSPKAGGTRAEAGRWSCTFRPPKWPSIGILWDQCWQGRRDRTRALEKRGISKSASFLSTSSLTFLVRTSAPEACGTNRKDPRRQMTPQTAAPSSGL